MADTQATALSLFSGIGGLDLGWELVTGGRVVGYCERDAYAASVLLGRMEDQAMECAPVWCGDVADLDLAPFLGVGWVIGGFPCQDISVAGAGAGIGGERSGLWSELLRAYRDSGARYLFAENVSALAVRGLDRVLHDLAEIGADAEWLCLRASDVGASHRRERIFILADRERDALRHESGRRGRQDRPGRTGPRDVGEGVAHAEDSARRRGAQRRASGHGRPELHGSHAMAHHHRAGCTGERGGGVQHGQRAALGHDADGCDTGMADASSGNGLGRTSGHTGHAAQCEQGLGQSRGAGLEVRAGKRGNDAAQCSAAVGAGVVDHAPSSGPARADRAGIEECGSFAPGPGGPWDRIPAHLHPAIEPGLHVLADGTAVVVDESWADQLRCVGNGVVPLQAAAALVELLRRIQE